jgi:hypothetical protein
MIFSHRYLRSWRPIKGFEGFVQLYWVPDYMKKPTISICMMESVPLSQTKKISAALKKADKIVKSWIKRENKRRIN